MDANATGRFIAERRRQKGLTQKELANKLQVTDKAISRWETGKGLPDISLLRPLSEILEVSISELLSGKIIEESDREEQTEKILLDALNYSRQMLANMMSLILSLVGIALLVSPLFIAGRNYNCMIGVALIGIAFLNIYLKRANKAVKLTNKRTYIIAVALLAFALLLELLPIGAVLIFAPGPNETMKKIYSYFNFKLVGYANFTPLLTGILTIAGILLGSVSVIKYDSAKKLKSAVFTCSVIAAALSLAPLFLFGFAYMTLASYAIFAAIIISICFQAIANRNS